MPLELCARAPSMPYRTKDFQNALPVQIHCRSPSPWKTTLKRAERFCLLCCAPEPGVLIQTLHVHNHSQQTTTTRTEEARRAPFQVANRFSSV